MKDKKRKIYDAITNVDADLIEEASKKKEEKKSPGYKTWLAVAAAILVVVLLLPLMLDTSAIMPRIDPRHRSSSSGKALLGVVYPKAYAFDDYDSNRDVIDQYPVSKDFMKAVKNFSYRSAQDLLAQKKMAENLNFSPLGLYYTLALAATGADGDTAAELFNLLAVEDSQVLSQECKNLYNRLYFDNKIGKLLIANSLWLDNDFNGEKITYKDDFVKNAAKNFYASSHSVDFSNPNTAKYMENWVSENTKGKLQPKIELSSEQLMSILNTIYFHDQWKDRFSKSKTAEDIFYLNNGEEIKGDFMNAVYSSASFYRGENFTRSGLALKNRGSMQFILPDPGVSLDELYSSVESLKEAVEGGKQYNGEVTWQIPKFDFSTKLDLKENLLGMGIEKIFSEEANFDSITEQKVFINDISQDSRITINEEGVSAAAFTKMDYAGAAQPEDHAEMILNRPFLYCITGPNISEEETILFIGVCENPF